MTMSQTDLDNEKPMPNIWTLDDDETEEDLRPKKDKEDEATAYY